MSDPTTNQGSSEKVKAEYRVLVSRETPGEWRVETIIHDGEDGICSAVFHGSDAKIRAEEYAAWQAKSEESDDLLLDDVNIWLGAFSERRRIAKYLREAAERHSHHGKGTGDEAVTLLRIAFDVLTGHYRAEIEPSSLDGGVVVPADDSPNIS